MVDTQELRESACGRVDFLGFHHCISQAFMASVKELVQKRLVKTVRRFVQTEPAGRERRNGTLAFHLQKRFGERVEVREVKIPVQAVHGKQERLRGLWHQIRHIIFVQDLRKVFRHIQVTNPQLLSINPVQTTPDTISFEEWQKAGSPSGLPMKVYKA